jgi:DNA anti-recombination protein RmuC
MGLHYVTETIPMPSEDRPATKQDLDLLRADVDQRFVELRADVDQRFDQLQETLIEQMRDMQTEMLRAFHAWARPFEIRMRALPQIEERLGLLEERVSAIERGDKPH